MNIVTYHQKSTNILEKSEIKELENLVRLHEESIFTCNMKLANADRRIAVEKGLKTRSSEKYSGIIEAMNLESSSKEKLMNNREIKMSRDRGVIKMISTKHAITMNREKSSLAKTKEFYDSHKVSLPLLLFDNLLEKIKVIQQFNTHESMRVVLCTVLSLMIPSLQKRVNGNAAKNSICNLLGLSDKSSLTKHIFNRFKSADVG